MDTDKMHDILRKMAHELSELDQRSRILSERVNVERAKEDIIRKTVQKIEDLADSS